MISINFSFEKDSTFGFICRDPESLSFYQAILKEELGSDVELMCSILKNKPKVDKLLQQSDALLTSPPVYERVKELSPAEVPVYNVFDKVDPISMKVIKDTLIEMI
ncbi:hypothetical protein KGY73_01325 [bacterium]|nr:hypothetical protein [bacterium]